MSCKYCFKGMGGFCGLTEVKGEQGMDNLCERVDCYNKATEEVDGWYLCDEHAKEQL